MSETHNAAELQGFTISGIQDGVSVCQNCDEAFVAFDDGLLCPACHQEEEEREFEFEAVIELLAEHYPGTVDYNLRGSDLFDLLDENDNVIATITERDMAHAWNLVEGGAQ